MKRTVIILLIILLTWNTGMADDITQCKITYKIDSLHTYTVNVNSGTILQPYYCLKKDFLLEGWLVNDNIFYNFNDPVVKESLTLKAKWVKIADIKAASEEYNKLKKQMRLLLIAIITISILLLLLMLCIFHKFKNNKKKFRDNILKELEDCKQGGRMDKYQQSVIEKAIEQLKKTGHVSLNSDKSSDNEVASAINELRNRIKAIEVDKSFYSTSKKEVMPPIDSQSVSLYADSIYNGKFNRVRETPNEDTIFELKLNHSGGSRANVVVYREAYRKVIANPSYLEGCEKQILGNTNVTMLRDGVAGKDDSGNWTVLIKPEVKIS